MISIVIPCFNMQEYLADSIESALEQNAQEIIVIDDGSTDYSLEIACKYPVKVVSQVNKGLASARNTGIMNAKGDYILFLDADDILLPNCVKRITEVIGTTKADVIAPSFKCFGTSQDNIVLMKHPMVADFKTANRIGYCTAIKREVLLEVGGYSPKMVHGWEDYHLWFNLLSLGKKFVTIPEILWLYRTKDKSMWTESVEHSEELWSQIYKDFPKL